MSVISGTEATYLLEARLDRTYTGELRPSIQLIDSWHSTGATQQRGGVTEELRRASRRVEGYWKRVILLYQNNQLRANFFAPGSAWLQRSRVFRAAAQPLDAQIRLGEPANLDWTPMSKQYPLRPHTFHTLEELERQAQSFAGEETLKRFIAKRKEALRLCDEEARKRYAASAKEMRHQAQSEAEPLGAARALSLREKFFAQAASPSKAPRVTTPAVQIPSTDAPTADQPAPEQIAQAPTTPAQPALDIIARKAARTPLQAPAEEPSDTAELPNEGPESSANAAAAALHTRSTAAATPTKDADAQPAEGSGEATAAPHSLAELADTAAMPSTLIRELASGEEQGAESDEADRALSALMAQQPASGGDISAPAQQALSQTAVAEPVHAQEAERDMREGVAPAMQDTGAPMELVRVAEKPASMPQVTAAQAEETLVQEAALQQVAVQRRSAAPAEQPATSAAPAPEEAAPAATHQSPIQALPEGRENVRSDRAREESAGPQQMQTVRVAVRGAPQQLKPENPFFELKSFNPELMQAAEQQRSMSLNSNQSTDTQQNKEPLPDNPFFEIRGPASSPEQLLQHATQYLLGGELPSATAADLGMIPMSRANTEPISGQGSAAVPAAAHVVAAHELGPKTPRQPDMSPEKLAPAMSALQSVPLAPVAEQPPAEEASAADADVSFLDTQPSAQPKPLPSTSSEGDASSRQSSNETSSGKSSDIYLPTWKGVQGAPAEGQPAVKAETPKVETPAPASSKGKDKVEDAAAGSSAPNSGRLPSWLPSTPGQSMEAFPKAALMSQGSMSGPLSSGSSNSWSGSVSNKAFQMAEQLRHGNATSKITGARRLQRLAATRSQVGDAVWEAEGVLALTAMLDSQDPQQFDAAASAIAELANPDNRAFQIGVGESGGLRSLLTAMEGGSEAQSALAAKALGSVVRGTPALQEVLLDAGGADVLIRHLDAQETAQADKETGTEAPHDDSPGLLSLQSVEPAEEGAPEACKEEEVAGAIAAFTSGYSPGQRAIVGAGGLPKLTQLLTSDSPAVQDKALSALLACTTKNAEYQALMTEAGALPHLAQLAKGAPAQPSQPESDDATKGGKAADELADDVPPRATVMAQKALKLLFSLASYFAGHAALQAEGCLDVLVSAMASSDAICTQYAVWAIQSLTAGNSKTEKGLCEAGAIQSLLGLIRRCQEQPEEDVKPAKKSSRKPRAAPPSVKDLLEPAIVALSNLAAETASVKDDMRRAGAIEACVQLLVAKGTTVPGHAARALWNLTSKNTANQDAAKEAGAIPLLIAMLGTAPKQGKGKKVSTCEEAAGTVGSMATCNAPNQEAFRVAGALPLLLELVLTAERSIKEQAAWALHAMTGKNEACMEDMVGLEAPARLLPLLSHPELWNWTPVVSTMQNMSGGTQQAQHALVRADAMTVFLDILSFGRPTLQAVSATILGNLASSGDEDFKKAFAEAGGLEKLRELCKSGSLASAPVRKAAASALADITKGKPRQAAQRQSKRRISNILSSQRWCMGSREHSTRETT